MKSEKLIVKKTKPGFSLIELLVVIGIIGILSTLGLSSYTKSQQRSRDAKRRADLKTIQNAFEQYYQNSNYVYPTNMNQVTSYFAGGVVPTDPRSGVAYTGILNTALYSITAALESEATTITVVNLQ